MPIDFGNPLSKLPILNLEPFIRKTLGHLSIYTFLIYTEIIIYYVLFENHKKMSVILCIKKTNMYIKRHIKTYNKRTHIHVVMPPDTAVISRELFLSICLVKL